MSEPTESAASEREGLPPPEDQRQRWMKYGANVVLTGVIVLVLAIVVVVVAQAGDLRLFGKHFSFKGRADMTLGSSQSLRPQTVSVIHDLNSKVTLVSLYPRLKQDARDSEQDLYQPVVDKLEEYRRQGHNIDVQVIDPIAEPAKLDAWIGEVKRKYGGNISAYEDLLKGFPKTIDAVKKQASAEATEVNKTIAQINEIGDKLTPEQIEKLERTIIPARGTVLRFPQVLQILDDQIKQELEQKIPNYEGALSGMKSGLQGFSRQCEGLVKVLNELKDDKDAPDAAKQYAAAAVPRFQAMKKVADDALDKTKNLGEVKFDEVRRKLIPPNETDPTPPAIVVMGESDLKVIELKDAWKSGQSTGLTGSTTDKPKLRFTGEQQITAAVLALQQPKKPKVVFCRNGGPPLTTGGGMFGAEARMSDIAERLKGYNYDVLEKDMAGQPPQQRMPAAPEPSDEDIKDALWIVFDTPADPQMGMGMPPMPVLGPKLKEHLDQGGSALCLIDLRADDLSVALKDWGIEVKPNALVVHEPIRTDAGTGEDFIEEARRQPPIFILNDFGTHPLARSVQTLDAALVPLVPVRRLDAPPADVTVTPIIPVPTEPPSWGETNIEGITRTKPPTFDKDVDVAGPLYAGAVAEKKGKGKLVVIGCIQLATNGMLAIPDPKLQKAKIEVARFPGNGELFTNSVFWLTGNEKLMALSPAALDTARIQPIGPGALAFWRWGMFLILPCLALVAGFLVYQSRRE